MGFELIDSLNQKDRQFVERAVEACEQFGDRAALLLVGSRAAGFEPVWDLDLWVIGDKRCLSSKHLEQYEAHGQLFVDRGDLEAHWTFYDEEDLVQRLNKWPSEMMWILATSKFIHGCKETHEGLRARFAEFPRDVAGSKLKWLLGFYRSLLSPMYKVAGAGCVTGALAIAGQAISALCKLCCAAECRPWPYAKWLTKVARATRLGERIVPLADQAAQAFLETPKPLPGQQGPDWTPRRQLRLVLDALPALLNELDWEDDWVNDPWQAVEETFKRASP